MIELTPDAHVRFEVYLQRMRSALRGTRAVEASEVEQSVREHVELALASVPGPVGTDRLVPVLEQLGPPERWLADDERPAWKRFLERMQQGPEDWRLAYLSFAVSVVGILFLPVGGILLLIPAFILSRAWVSLMRERGAPMGARGWLVLPPIVFVFFLFLLGMLVSVVGIAGALATENDLTPWGIPRPGHGIEEGVLFVGFMTAVAGGWWIVLSGLLAFLFEPLRTLFAPVLDHTGRRWLFVLTGIGAICLAVGLRVMYIA